MVGVRQFDEDSVMQGALETFRRKGFSATSMSDLADGMGVHRGSLYNAYGGKEKIFLIAFQDYADRYISGIHNALNETDTREALERFFDFIISSMCADTPSNGCLTTRTATDSLLMHQQIQGRLLSWLDELESVVCDVLSKPDHCCCLSLDPKAAAQVLTTFTRGLAVMERVHNDETRLRKTASELVEIIIRQ